MDQPTSTRARTTTVKSAVVHLLACAFTATLLTACATGLVELSTRKNAPLRADLLAAAKTEWEFFGRQQIDMRSEILSAPRLGLLEDEGEAVGRIGLYWQTVGKNFTGADTQQAWSAVFISYVFQQAGISADDFLPSDVHFNYLTYLKARQSKPEPLFVLRPAATTSVAPGDLICAPRGSNSVTTIEEIRPGLPGHCDLVYEVHPILGWAGVIGGNVFNSVSESLIPIDVHARLLPISQRPWFVVVKNLMP